MTGNVPPYHPHSYVGNSVTTFVLQTLGIEVSALNTVQFSNHTGYQQWRGFKTTAQQVEQLWQGLKECNIAEDYGMMLSGYIPDSDGVESVGRIAQELRSLKEAKGETLFWLLDPVMGDNDKLYVSEEVPAIYMSLLSCADLIMPNAFETELLCGIKLDSIPALSLAIDTMHAIYHIPHIVITSVTFPSTDYSTEQMICVGSTMTSAGGPRKFVLPVTIIPGQFVGTGDMFSALTLARFREEAAAAGLLNTRSWMSPDEVDPTELPLAKALEKVLGSMHGVLELTRSVRDGGLAGLGHDKGGLTPQQSQAQFMKASELQLIKGQRYIVEPGEDYKAVELSDPVGEFLSTLQKASTDY